MINLNMVLHVSKKASLNSNQSITHVLPNELLKSIVQFCDVKPYLSKVFSQHSFIQESIKALWIEKKPWLKKPITINLLNN